MGIILWFTIIMAAAERAHAFDLNITRHWGDEFYLSTLLQHLDPPFKIEKCTAAIEQKRYIEIMKSDCGKPKSVLVKLPTPVHMQIYPFEVWVSRCVGFCSPDVLCMATKRKTIQIAVRLYDVKTDKESCAVYPVNEHLSCGCNYEDS